MNKYLSIVTLNVKGLNAPIKRHRIVECIRKHDPHICCLQETHLRTKDLHRLKVKSWKQIFQANGQEKKSWGSNTPIGQNRLQKKGQKDPHGHFIILKGRIHQEDINIVNTYAPNIGAPKYIKKILKDFKKDIDSNKIIIGDFNIPLSKRDRPCKQNINKDIVSLNNTLEKMDLKKGAIKRDPEDHFLTLKGRIHQEDKNIVNIYAPHIGAPKNIKKTLEDSKKDIGSNTIIVGDFNTHCQK